MGVPGVCTRPRPGVPRRESGRWARSSAGRCRPGLSPALQRAAPHLGPARPRPARQRWACSRPCCSSARSSGASTSSSTGRSGTGCARAMASSAPEELSPRAREIVAAARQILERSGPEGLSMRAIADDLGIRAPSLYKHVADKEALEVALISDALAEIAEAFEHAAAGSDDPLASIAAAYRGWALDHPHLYRLMMDRPLPRDRLAPGLEDRAAPRSWRRPAATPTRPVPRSHSPTGWSCSSSTTASRPAPTSPPPGGAASTRSALPAEARSGSERLDRGHGPDPVADHERETAPLVPDRRTWRARRRLRGRSGRGSRAGPGAAATRLDPVAGEPVLDRLPVDGVVDVTVRVEIGRPRAPTAADGRPPGGSGSVSFVETVRPPAATP